MSMSRLSTFHVCICFVFDDMFSLGRIHVQVMSHINALSAVAQQTQDLTSSWYVTDNSLIYDMTYSKDLSTQCTTTQDLTFESFSQTSAEILNSRLAPSMCSSYISAKEPFIFWGSFANMKGSFAHMYAEKFSKVGSLPTCALRIRNRALHMRKRDLHIRKRAQENDNPADFWEHHICLTFENITFVSRWVQGANRRRETGKRALYFRKRALHIHKRALENNHLTFGKITFAWLLRTSYLSDHHVCQLSSTRSQPSTWYWQKCPAYSKKSPIYSQKSLTHSPHNPTYLAQSPKKWPMS